MGVDMKAFAQAGEFREIQTAFPLFDLPDPGMRDAQSPGQGSHGQSSGLPARPQPP